MELHNAYARRLEIAGVFVFRSQSTSYNEVSSSRLVWFGVSCIFLSVDWKCRLDMYIHAFLHLQVIFCQF